MAKQQVSKDGEKVIVKKKGGCGTFFAGFFCAIIFLVLLVGGGGAYVYFCVNLQQVESLFGIKLPIEGDINKKTVKDLVALGLELKDSYVHMKIGELETKVGIKLPEKVPGTDIDISYLYEEGTTINFKGATIAIKNIEVMDAINNMNEMVDGVIVIGGRNSANTNRLFATAQSLCKMAILIEHPDEISESIRKEFSSLKKIGITAGASTPDDIIDAVEEKMRAL